MQLKVAGLSLLAASVAAQSQTTNLPSLTASTSAPATTETSLPALVAELPQCALSCFASAAETIKCAATDFTCLCSKSQELLQNIGPCILISSGCNQQDVAKANSVAPQICAAVSANPNSSQIASASNIVTSALGTAATPTTTSTRTNAAAADWTLGWELVPLACVAVLANAL